MTLPTRPGCSCATCARLTSSICEKCHRSSCAHALWCGYECNAEADARHGATAPCRAKSDPIHVQDFVKEA